ncbi:MAG: DUF4097 family beta strand repeat-containing protein [Acidobacteriota bacterium]|nr:DUF4097 family beta strand repeat-containing protein [Acidobacteriota bacterium]
MAFPLVLIIIGALALINNLRPALVDWGSVGRYWPFILIVFGLVRLFEILIDAGRGKPLPTRSIPGGVFVVLLAATFFFWAAARHHFRWQMGRFENGGVNLFGEQFDYQMKLHGNATGASMLVLDNARGNVSIDGADGDDVEVDGHKMIRAYNKQAADDADRKTSFEIVREGDRMVLRTGEDRASGDRRVSMDLDIKVPRRMSVEARTRSGDLTVGSLNGGVNLSGDRGDVRLTDVGGNVKVELNHSSLVRVTGLKGALDLQGRGSDVQLENIAGQVTITGFYSGTLDFRNLSKPLHFESPQNQTDVRVEQVPGSLTMDLGEFRANNVVGPIRVVAKSRDIDIENFSESLDIDLDRGDIQIKPERLPLSKMDVHARNGNVALALPENANFTLKATTSHGEAQNDYGDAVRVETEGHSASLKSVADKGPAISASTDRGTISVSKGAFTAPIPNVSGGLRDAGKQIENAREEARRGVENARRHVEDARRQADEARREITQD